MTFANRSPPGAAKGSWLDAYPNVRARLNAKSETEPGYTGYKALVMELLKLPELSDFDASKGSKDYKWIYDRVKHFFSNKRRTSEMHRAANIKYGHYGSKNKKRAARLPARLRIVYL